MVIGSIDTASRAAVVAEIGNNHEGSFDRAAELIGLAAGAGAHAVKFQTYRTGHYVSPVDTARVARLKRFELSFDQFADLAQIARGKGLGFLSTPFDLESARFLDGIVDAFKIASGDVTFIALLEAVARTGKPILLSTGMATMQEIADARAIIERVWRRDSRVPCFVPPSVQDRDHSGQSMLHARAMKHGTQSNGGIDQNLALLHCVSAYPVPNDQANLAAIDRLRQTFQCTVGYSDHTLGIEAAALSVAAGAKIVEKHFTISKDYSDFRDHQLSADPAEFAELVRRVEQAGTLMGTGEKAPQPCEIAAIASLRRSIAAAADLPAGAMIRMDDLTWVRPASGLPPGQEHLLLGRSLVRAVAAGELITTDLLVQTDQPCASPS